MELALRRAAAGREPVTAIREMSSAYIKFAKDKRIAGSDRAAQASVALWAFLHGAVALEAAEVLGESKPASGLDSGSTRERARG